ncbi:MAG: carboxypeptidase-like regulatory domain-containing protein [Bacteroidetes bacterium]|nr:carboxypeptidase-like regulatory domain-containing protein [Bacteroidota bacterium]MCY4205152.1 carboxypeptidase-like regulatory domain-containing protein [Bacteroidota bacterium]
MRFKQLLSFLGLLVFIAPTALAQQGKIDGVVTDAATGETVPGASVVIEGTAQGAATQADGYFFINNVRPGTYTLLVSFIGYTTQRVEEVRVSTGLTTTRDIQLTEEAVGMDELGGFRIGADYAYTDFGVFGAVSRIGLQVGL